MTINSDDLPFQPIRTQLYSAMDLMAGFAPDEPDSMAQTLDFRSYQYFMASGGAAPMDPYAGMMEALHDNSIMRAMTIFLADVENPVVAIMGGHNERRDSANYARVVEISRRLTKNKCLVASGGGPGAMEATHLGALLAHASDETVAAALKRLAEVPELPKSQLVVAEGTGAVDGAIARQLHAWVKPAFEIAQEFSGGGQSLAVPTWYYGHEPTSPLATHVAKYFQNSIREDVLLSLAANGIIYTEGAAGTLQEVFQDAAQNYYPKKGQTFAPMIFFGADFWTKTLPVRPVLEALFVGIKRMPSKDFDQRVSVVDTVDHAVECLLRNEPTKEKTVRRMDAMGFGAMMSATRRATQ